VKRLARRRLAATLTLAALLPAGLLAWDTLPLLLPAGAPAPAATTAPPPPLDEARLAVEPLAAFAETRERPLFVATRRYAPAGAQGSDELVLGKYAVQGVVMLPKRSFVLLKAAKGGQTLRVAEGDRLEGHLLEKVQADGIVVSGPTGRRSYPVGGRK